MPVYSLTFRNRAVALLAALVVLGAGAALLVVGIALLAGIAIAGGLLGTGILLYRKLRGQPVVPFEIGRQGDMDPSLEVFAEQDTLEYRVERDEPNDESPRLPPSRE